MWGHPAFKRVLGTRTDTKLQSRTQRNGLNNVSSRIYCMHLTAALTATQLVDTALHAIREKKGYNISILDLRHLPNALCDFMVVCSGSSDTQTGAICDSVEKELRDLGERPFRSEGKVTGEWILLDYINVVVHIFLPRVREYYNLEELWGDARTTFYEA